MTSRWLYGELMPNRLIAALLTAAALAGVLLELLCSSVRDWLASHQFTTALMAESLLLLAVYLFVNRWLERRESERWERLALPLIWDLWEVADALRSALAQLATPDSSREIKDRRYRIIETLATGYREALNNLYPILTTSPDLAQLIPLAKRVGETARYAATELNVDLNTDGKLYADFLEAHRKFEDERQRMFPSLARRDSIAS